MEILKALEELVVIAMFLGIGYLLLPTLDIVEEWLELIRRRIKRKNKE